MGNSLYRTNSKTRHYTEKFKRLSRNSDNNLESQYPYSNAFDLQSDSKLLSGFSEELVNYSVYKRVCLSICPLNKPWELSWTSGVRFSTGISVFIFTASEGRSASYPIRTRRYFFVDEKSDLEADCSVHLTPRLRMDGASPSWTHNYLF
jgi:hypothetical protein